MEWPKSTPTSVKMLQAGKWGIPSTAKGKSKAAPKTQTTTLSEDELRRRILANATVLFPSASPTNAFEIVYASRPRVPTGKESATTNNSDAELPPWQYAMLVRRSPSGNFSPLIRGVAWSSQASWGLVLQGLLDATARAVHERFAGVRMPGAGVEEELPQYRREEGVSQ